MKKPYSYLNFVLIWTVLTAFKTINYNEKSVKRVNYSYENLPKLNSIAIEDYTKNCGANPNWFITNETKNLHICDPENILDEKDGI